MVKRCYSVFITLIALCFFPLPVYAHSYSDTCADTQTDHIKSYSGFTLQIADFGGFAQWPDYKNRPVLSVQAGRAAVTYRISGAEQLEAHLFAHNSTVASERSNLLVPGFSENTLVSELHRCLYHTDSDTIFMIRAGTAYSLQCTRSRYQFFEDNTLPINAGHPFYGLNVEVSRGGTVYLPLETVRLVQAVAQRDRVGFGAYYHETYRAAIPQGVTHIRLTVQTARRVRGNGTSDATLSENALLFGGVEFTGSALFPGRETPASSTPLAVSSTQSSQSEPSNSFASSDFSNETRKKRRKRNKTSSQTTLNQQDWLHAQALFSRPEQTHSANTGAVFKAHESVQTQLPEDRLPVASFVDEAIPVASPKSLHPRSSEAHYAAAVFAGFSLLAVVFLLLFL